MPRAAKRDPKYAARHFGEWLTQQIQQRIDEGVFQSQRHAAETWGWSVQCISDWVRGHSIPDRAEDVARLAMLLDVDEAKLIELIDRDKVDYWRDSLGLTRQELVEIAEKNLQDATVNGNRRE